MPTDNPLCLLGIIGLLVWCVRWVWRNSGNGLHKQRALERGLLQRPDAAFKAIHLPADEASLRALKLGPDSARILKLFRTGELAMGAVVEFDAQTRRVGPTTKSTRFVRHYGWFDSRGRYFHGRTDRPDTLLNSTFVPLEPDTFLVAFDPKSGDHVVFFGNGGTRVTAPVPKPRAPEPITRSPLIAADSEEQLIEAAAERIDDDDALLIIAARLTQFGHPLGAQLTYRVQNPGVLIALANEPFAALLTPPGAMVDATHRGFPSRVRWWSSTRPDHVGWRSVRELRVDVSGAISGSPFERALPNLRVLDVAVQSLPADHFARVEPQLETLIHQLVRADALPAMRPSMERLVRLRRYELRSLLLPTREFVEWVMTAPPPRLETLVVRSSAHNVTRDDLFHLQNRLARRDLPWAIELAFSLEHAREQVWLRITASGISLHVKGSVRPHELLAARTMFGGDIAVTVEPA